MRTVAQPAFLQSKHYHRRGSVIPLVAVSTTTLLAFTALTIDVGLIYHVRAELQRTADAAALAAASELGAKGADNPLARARMTAADYALRNTVLNEPLRIDPATDVIFGHAHIGPDGKYVFEPTEAFPNAVRVRARRTAGSPAGPVPAFFAGVFGLRSVNVSATATAVLTPRDIAFVLDLSASHNDDSSLVHYRLTDIRNREVWVHLWDTDLAPQPMQNGLPVGPTFGNMTAWGTEVTGPGWNYANDPGLVQLKRGVNWNHLTADWINQSLIAQGLTPYTSKQITTIKTAGSAGPETNRSSSSERANYRRRVRVALGIDRWIPSGSTDTTIGANEVVNLVPYPSGAINPATKCRKIGGSWDEYIDYVSDITKADNITSNTGLSQRFLMYDPDLSYYGNPQLRWRFGLKTLVDFPQDKYPSHNDSPGLAGAPEEPMGAVANAVQESLNIIESLESNDLVGTAAYSTQGYGPAQKPSALSWLTDDLNLLRDQVATLQAGMWSTNTNIAQGIDRGAEVLLQSPRSRDNAAKIMILLTDGNANQTRSEPSQYLPYDRRPIEDTLKAARDAHLAHPQRIRIYCVSVGVDSDQELMEQVAQIGQGEHFHAGGDVESYREQLQQIFRDLGGRRSVVLME